MRSAFYLVPQGILNPNLKSFQMLLRYGYIYKK